VPVHGILLDLGLSSLQLDSESRGFSFRRPDPLDMRFSLQQRLTAADIVNTYSQTEIADLIYRRYNTLHKSKAALEYEAHTLRKMSGYDEGKLGLLSLEKIKGIGAQFNLVQNENHRLETLDTFIYAKNDTAANLDVQLNDSEIRYLKKMSKHLLTRSGIQ